MKMQDLVLKTLGKKADSDAPLRIVQAGHPALRATSAPLAGQLSDDVLETLINAMVVTMHEAPGVGVAAPQIGVPLRLVVMEDAVGPDDSHEEDPYNRTDLPLMAVANPRYEPVPSDSATTFGWEGCLSVDGWRSLVPRPRSVRVLGTAFDADGTTRDLDEVWSGWKARIFQHEADHLDGILCHDRSVPRSFVHENYQGYYTDLSEAVHYLGVEGEVSQLEPGQVDLER